VLIVVLFLLNKRKRNLFVEESGGVYPNRLHQTFAELRASRNYNPRLMDLEDLTVAEPQTEDFQLNEIRHFFCKPTTINSSELTTKELRDIKL
jgi:hypothetical protein